jgi:ribosomal protein L11 methyltransferase
MAVFELKAEIAAGMAEILAEALAEADETRVMVTEDKPSGRAWLTGYFESQAEARTTWAQLSAQLGPECAALVPIVHQLADADWKESYKAHFTACQFGPLHWVPVWERETFRLPAGGQVLWLDPGMAFGTGNHETTRLCCERLVSFAAERGASGRVIDAGCGSGILALSAAKLGLGPVAAFDNDPVAVAISEENAALNGLAGQVKFFVGDLVSGLAGRRADLVLANIQADVLVRFARELAGAVAPGGQLVLSGILERELAQVQAIFGAADPAARLESRTMGEWSDLVLTRPA